MDWYLLFFMFIEKLWIFIIKISMIYCIRISKKFKEESQTYMNKSIKHFQVNYLYLVLNS
jgi:hypothetical protein